MAAVRREAMAPPPIPFPWTRAAPGTPGAWGAAVRGGGAARPPIPFPWTRAAPGIAAALLIVVFAVASLGSSSSAEAPPRVPEALERAVELTAQIGNSVASWD